MTIETVDHVTQEFYTLGTPVHVYGIKGNSPENAVHGVIASPLVPIHIGGSNALGYLVHLDQPMEICCEGTVDGTLGVIFVHYSAVSESGGSPGVHVEEYHE